MKKGKRGRTQRTIFSFFPSNQPTHAEDPPTLPDRGSTAEHPPTHVDPGSAAKDPPTHVDQGSAAKDTPTRVDLGSAVEDPPLPVDSGSAAEVCSTLAASSSQTPTIISSASESEEETPHPKKKKKRMEKKKPRVKKFQTEWLTQYPWLAFDGDAMYCKWCKEKRQDTVWATTGTTNFRVKTLKKHVESKVHKATLAAKDPKQQTVAKGLRAQELKNRQAVEAALRTVYWLANEEVANRKYESLLELQKLQGVEAIHHLHRGGNATHTSPTTFNDLLACLNEVVERQVAQEVRASNFVAIGIDESTDRSSEKHIVLVVRYVRVHTGELITTFLKCDKVDDGTADTIYSTTKDILQMYNIPLRKVVGLGMDGAAVMSSDLNGVTGLLHRDNPFAVAVHCVCHRLQLAVSQACKTDQRMTNASGLVDNIYNYISQSPKRVEEFKTMVDALGDKYIKLKHVFEVRWLSMGEAVDSMLRNYRALAVYTEDKAERGDATAIGLHNQLTSFLPMALLHLLGDVLDATNHLSRLFQYRDITFSALRGQLADCLQVLETMREVDGPKLARFRASVAANNTYMGVAITMLAGRGGRDPLEALATIKLDLLNRLLANLRSRFPRVDLLDAMKIFEPAAYPRDDNVALAYWGRQDLAILLDHYAEQKETRDGNVCEGYIDRFMCEGQFVSFKQTVVARFSGEERAGDDGEEYFHFFRPSELLEKMFDQTHHDNQQIFSEVFKLLCLCLMVLVSNAEAERVFSCQNRIKTNARTRLGAEQLDRLIRLSYAPIPLADFNYAAARDIYFQAPRRF